MCSYKNYFDSSMQLNMNDIWFIAVYDNDNALPCVDAPSIETNSTAPLASESSCGIMCRPPNHGLRIHQRPGTDHDIQEALKELSSENVEWLPSQYLPDEFIRVMSGLQSVIHTGMLADGHCSIQVNIV